MIHLQKKIWIVFSKPMQDKISINLSKNGKEHFPLQNIAGLDESKIILTLETTNLQPNTEYKIAFRTDSK